MGDVKEGLRFLPDPHALPILVLVAIIKAISFGSEAE